MTARPPSWPSVPDLRADPELAILAALDALLILATRSLAALHPSVSEPDQPYWQQTPTDRVAPDVVLIANQLLAALESYRNAFVIERRPSPSDDAFEPGPPDDDDLPF